MGVTEPGKALTEISLELATHLRAFVAQPARRAELRKIVGNLIGALPPARNVIDPVQDVRAFGAALVAMMDRYTILEEGAAVAARAGDQARRMESELASMRSAFDTADNRAKSEYERASQKEERNRVLELQVQRDYVPVAEVRRLKEEFVRVDEARIAAERHLQQYQLSGSSSRDRVTDLERQVAEARTAAARLYEEIHTKDAELEEARKKQGSNAAEEAKQWFNAQLKALQGENRRVNDLVAEVRTEAESAKAQAETQAAKGNAELEQLKKDLEKAEAEARDIVRRLEAEYVSKRVLEEREQSHGSREKELEAKLREAEAERASARPTTSGDADTAEKEAEIKRLQNKLIEDRVAYDSWVGQLELANAQLKEQIKQLKGGGLGLAPAAPHKGPGPAPPKE